MQTVESMQEIIEYIESNMDKPIEIEALADRIYLSPFYFQRVFHKLVGRPVMEYIRLRRLAKASEEIKNGAKILETALAYGFSNHESFTRAFKAAYGITPMDLKKTLTPLQHFLKPDISLTYTMVDEGVPIIVSGIVLEVYVEILKEDLKAAGLERQCKAQDVGQDNPGMLWNKFHTVKKDIANKVQAPVELGISLPGKEEGSFTYMTLTQVASFEGISEDWKTFAVPAGLYVVCRFAAEDFYALSTIALDKAMSYLHSTWLPRSKYEIAQFLCCEYYDTKSFQGQPPEMAIYFQ